MSELDRNSREWIDKSSYEQLLRRWRFSPAGDAIFQGELGKYYTQVMARKRRETADNGVSASKRVGWDR